MSAFLTIDATAERLSVSTSTVRRLIAIGALPYIRVLRAVRIPEAALEGLEWQYVATPTARAAGASSSHRATAKRDGILRDYGIRTSTRPCRVCVALE